MLIIDNTSAMGIERALPVEGGRSPALSSAGIEGKWTMEEEEKLRNRMDWHILPLITVLYLMCFLDRANIGNARIQGMEDDLALQGFRFNWALTIFYIPYLLVEVPSNVLLKHVGAKIYIPFLAFFFGFVSLCCAFVRNYVHLYVARALLGFFEGGMFPGIAFFLSCFYRRDELTFRIALFISSVSTSGAFGGLLATGISKIPRWGTSQTPLNGWRNIFFVEGLMTILISVICYFWMENNLATCSFLSEREKYIAGERIRRENRENAMEKTSMKHIKRGIFNINNSICAFGMFFTNLSVQSFSLFLPTILRDLGWTATKAQLLTVPPYIIAAAWLIFISWISDRYKRRGVFAMGHALVSMMGYTLLVTNDRPAFKYMAVFFAAVGCFTVGPLFLSWGINNSAGPTIRAVSSGYIASAGTLGAIVATWTYLPSDAPAYDTGHTINASAQAAAAILSACGILYVRWENNKRLHGERSDRIQGLTEEEARELGYRHPEFRYIE